MEASNERFDHERLESIDKSRADAGEIANPEVGAEGNADRGQDVQARCRVTVLDPGEMRPMDPDDSTEVAQRQAGVKTQAADVLAKVEA